VCPCPQWLGLSSHGSGGEHVWRLESQPFGHPRSRGAQHPSLRTCGQGLSGPHVRLRLCTRRAPQYGVAFTLNRGKGHARDRHGRGTVYRTSLSKCSAKLRAMVAFSKMAGRCSRFRGRRVKGGSGPGQQHPRRLSHGYRCDNITLIVIPAPMLPGSCATAQDLAQASVTPEVSLSEAQEVLLIGPFVKGWKERHWRRL
jgi:hypothetical protein